jgi:pimeloyl-ACP methyl ester carboxylesterase
MKRAPSLLKFLAPVLTSLTIAAAVVAQDSVGAFEAACKTLIGQELPGGEVVVAQFVPQGEEGATSVPAHCKIQGKLNERRGIEAKRYAIGFELRLPRNWNQRFYFQGGGGTDGVLRPALGSLGAGGLTPNALSNGFAVASTDAGHLNETGIQGPYLFGIDPQARADYGYNHLPTVTSAARTLMEDLYGAAPKRSYFVGCSNGGRQDMMATQRFPELFDGVIASAPAYRVVEASLDAARHTQLFARVAPKDAASGRPILGGAFTSAELDIVGKGILQACDALDGIADGMVNNVRDCKFDPIAVQCATDDAQDCIAPSKADALRQAFAAARNDTGELIYSAWPFDPGIATPLWTSWKLGPATAMPPRALNTTLVAGALSHVFFTPPTPTSDLYGFVLNLDLDAVETKLSNANAPYLEPGRSVVNATSSDIDAFTARGGKLILYHGMADGIFSPTDTVRYFDELKQRYGDKARDFSRLYLIPGMGHCSGGPATDRFDAVSELVKWVEEGKAPDAIIAKAGTLTPWPNRSRPLCPYPKQAMYLGKGDVEDATSFECR